MLLAQKHDHLRDRMDGVIKALQLCSRACDGVADEMEDARIIAAALWDIRIEVEAIAEAAFPDSQTVKKIQAIRKRASENAERRILTMMREVRS